jgi:murein DD-endopeptidase MepM/ murein hydrolase activator NlpD
MQRLFTLLFLGLASAPALACFEVIGEARQGALLWAKLSPSFTRAWLGEEELRISPEGIVVFGFGRDETGTVVLGALAFDTVCEVELEIQSREYRISHVDGVPQRTVEPPPGELDRIHRERLLVRAAKADTSTLTDFVAGFQWPLTGRISGVYGSQRVYNGKPGNPHWGVDVAQPTGTLVGAPAPGRVTLAEPDLFYSGGTIIIDHGSEVSSSFLHLSEVSVEVGQRVEPGDIIGKVGATGRATGPHLDWRMSWRNRRVDPQLLVPPMP